jgi:hypothetical protein
MLPTPPSGAKRWMKERTVQRTAVRTRTKNGIFDPRMALSALGGKSRAMMVFMV